MCFPDEGADVDDVQTFTDRVFFLQDDEACVWFLLYRDGGTEDE